MTRTARKRKALHLRSERTRHGKLVWYVRVGHEARTRIREEYGTDAFWGAYRAAVEGAPKPEAVPVPAKENTIGWLIAEYTTSGKWKGLAAVTARNRLAYLKQVDKGVGTLPIKKLNKPDVLYARDSRKDQPHAANNLVLAVRAMFQWAIANDKATTDPTAGVELLRPARKTLGFHAWTEAEVAQFQARWPIGTRERVAFDVLLYTGLRRGDAVRLGPQHLLPHGDGHEFSIVTSKTGQLVTAPILPVLAATLAAGPVGKDTFITGQRGHAMHKDAFSNWFGDRCAAAGVPGRPHGLRKAGARRAAERGASDAQLNALFGWADGSKESAVYIRTADRAKMARAALTGDKSPAP